ncbi:alpha-mannosidase [Bifidobacterium aemilianum]|uniref:Alpha-mannosidase n=1 Tax=Bifidobacterium aemilianum TaxID=2493120 RepID=A0A366KBH3_9BIFI|nr:alpha-mannosidase [Bifidobacterium aemilianum]RBP98538.1 alpha-mannosidase [Bifidobacterium aemilianum]
MLLKVERETERCKRVMRERVQPHIHQVLGECTVSAFMNPGEPEDSREFLARVGQGMVDFQPLEPGEPWGTSWGTTWMKVEGQLPMRLPEGRPIELIFNLGWLQWPVGGHIEAMVYRPDGTVIKALHPRNFWMPLVDTEGNPDSVVQDDGSFTIYVEGAYNPNIPSFTVTELGTKPTGKADERYEFRSIDITALDRKMQDYWVDLDVVSSAVESLNSDDSRRIKLAKAMQRSINLWDERDYSTLEPAMQALSKVLPIPANHSAMTLGAMGHAHIDSAWLWPVRETKRKVARTVSNVLALMDQDPDFTFAMSSAQQYEWLEQCHPDLFERVRQRVAEGRFVPVGGMWVEADGMVPSGESLIRQISFGKRYFKEKFNVVPQGVWLPDSFGYTGAWPQIAKRSGYSWFLTQKLNWNDTTRLPHQSFMWEGVDGSQIFTHFPPADKYDSDMSAKDLAYVQRNYKDKDLSDRGILLFGYGDGGGGPTRDMALRERRFRDFEGLPKVEYDNPDSFFRKLESEMREEAGQEMPSWKGELYLELHRKTLTSQQDMKRGCRMEESWLRTVEYLGLLASLYSEDYQYPTEELNSIWKTLLLNQFHDILPGSSIEWVYTVARKEYQRDLVRLRELADAAIEAIAQANPEAKRVDHARICQFSLQAGQAWRPVAESSLSAGRDQAAVDSRSNEDGSVELDNGLLKVRIEPDGTVSSLRDVRQNRELVAEGARLGCYEILKDEPGMFDAWDVERDAFLCASGLNQGSISSLSQEAGGAVVVVAEHRYRETSIRTSIRLRPGVCSLDFHADVDWRVPEKLLKVDLPLAVEASRAQYECQYGLISRPIAKNTAGDEAMFESCTHRFVRIADSSYGVGVVNGSTYGSDVAPLRTASGLNSGTMLRLSLLAAPTAPDPRADLGAHEFDWSVVPSIETAQSLAAAAWINAPELDGLPDLPAPVSLDLIQGTAQIDWMKLADDDSGDIIVRLYEAAGSQARAKLRVGDSLASATVQETNTLEMDEHYEDEPNALSASGRSPAQAAVITLEPFQLCTLRIERD